MMCVRGYIMPIAAAKSLRCFSEVDRTATETACVLVANPRRVKRTAAKLRYAAKDEFVERRHHSTFTHPSAAGSACATPSGRTSCQLLSLRL